jgi:hypothetical protein
LTNPLIVTETVRGKDENALKITYGSGTGPLGTWIKAYRADERTREGVGRLSSGNPVEVRGGKVEVT